MYAINVAGGGITARATLLACRVAGFNDLSWSGRDEPEYQPPAATLAANLTRVVNALGRGEALLEHGHVPDREQVRIATSGFLLAELPLGRFIHDRYSAPHINIDNNSLREVLDPGALPAQTHDQVTVSVETAPTPTDRETTHTLWHASIEHDQPAHANVTWLGTGAHAWQFSTRSLSHVIFSLPRDATPDSYPWHASLTPASVAAEPVHHFVANEAPTVREHWYAGACAYAGAACFEGHPYRREANHFGLEDAWVLSRMLENYEEDFADGFAEYERYRRARLNRVARQAAATVALYDRSGAWARALRNVNIALAARFLPEIAMQRVDWLYNYDCIRGFR